MCYMSGVDIRESVDSLCRDDADTPMPPYIRKKNNNKKKKKKMEKMAVWPISVYTASDGL